MPFFNAHGAVLSFSSSTANQDDIREFLNGFLGAPPASFLIPNYGGFSPFDATPTSRKSGVTRRRKTSTKDGSPYKRPKQSRSKDRSY